MIINENKKIRLKTKNKYCTDDIDIIVDVPETANPYIATTATEMAQYLASKYDGAIVRYTGTTGTYTQNMLYKVKAVSSNEWAFDELITPVGSTTKTENGTYDVKEYASVVVNVPSGGGIEGGYNVSYSVNGVITKVISITPGDKIEVNPFRPNLIGYAFSGWSETDGGEAITYPYTPSGDVTLYAILAQGYQAIVKNLGSSSPSSVSFEVDTGFPTSFEQVTFNGDVFIKIPTMYKKVLSVSSNQITSFSIATAQLDSSYKPYPCFLDESGNLLPYVLIGKYFNNASTTVQSVQNTSKTSLKIGEARTMAMSRGTGYQLYDWMFQRLWQDLIIVAMKTVNINSGSGIDSDALGINWQKSGGWIDGITQTSGAIAVSYKPTKYVDSATTSTDGYVSVSYNLTTSNGEISKLGYDVNNPFVNYPSATVTNDNYNTYYCDQFYYNSGNWPFFSYVGNAYAFAGAFYCYVNGGWSYASGVRLCYRPLTA